MITLLIAMVLVCPILIVLLKTYEYEGDDTMVAFTSMILHAIFALVVYLAIVIAIMAIFQASTIVLLLSQAECIT